MWCTNTVHHEGCSGGVCDHVTYHAVLCQYHMVYNVVSLSYVMIIENYWKYVFIRTVCQVTCNGMVLVLAMVCRYVWNCVPFCFGHQYSRHSLSTHLLSLHPSSSLFTHPPPLPPSLLVHLPLPLPPLSSHTPRKYSTSWQNRLGCSPRKTMPMLSASSHTANPASLKRNSTWGWNNWKPFSPKMLSRNIALTLNTWMGVEFVVYQQDLLFCSQKHTTKHDIIHSATCEQEADWCCEGVSCPKWMCLQFLTTRSMLYAASGEKLEAGKVWKRD